MSKKFRILFNLLSFLFLGLLVVFYGYRLIYYYKLEHPSNSNEEIKFYQKLINNKGISGMNYGLQEDENEYIFGPKSTDNYLYYLGRIWRIVGIDENNNIKIITDESQTLLSWESDVSFFNSDINTWLNNNDNDFSGIFEKSLKQHSYILNQESNISLLTKKEYEKIGNDNYLVDGNSFWIIDEDNDIPTYVNNNGECVNDTNSFETFGVRPVIKLSQEVNYISGSGTKENPYIIYNYVPENLSATYVGEYLNYNNYLWRIIDVNDSSIKLAMDGYVETENQVVFSSYSNLFNANNGIGYYLNNDFYNTLSNNDYIIDSVYYNGNYNKNDVYSYLNTYDNSIDSKVGMYKIGDFFITDYNNFYTLTSSETASNIVYVVNQNNKLYADFITSEYKIRPILSLDASIFVLEGNGTKNNPYEIGR